MSKYALLLNDMRSPHVENLKCVKIGETEELKSFYNALLLNKPYYDGQWQKRFKKESELEWFNPCFNIDLINDRWGGIFRFSDETLDSDLRNFEYNI